MPEGRWTIKVLEGLYVVEAGGWWLEMHPPRKTGGGQGDQVIWVAHAAEPK